MDNRPTIDKTMMAIAVELGKRSTCCRRQVGCVLVDSRNHIIGTGYNGVASGEPHCTEHPCPGAKLPSGEGLDECEALHAEWNALQQCKDVHSIQTIYCTTSPCVTCVKMFLNTSAHRIVYVSEYVHPRAKELWLKKRREWCQMVEGWEDEVRPKLDVWSMLQP